MFNDFFDGYFLDAIEPDFIPSTKVSRYQGGIFVICKLERELNTCLQSTLVDYGSLKTP